MAGPDTTQPSPRTFVAPSVPSANLVLVVPANQTRKSLFVYNPGTITIAISSVDTTPVINGAGSITLNGLTGIQLDGWTNGLNAIAASGASNPITVLEFY